MDLPGRGSLVWLLFSPHAGREQDGRRRAIILTTRGYHELSDLAIVCPITSRERGWSTEVKLPTGLPISGVVLVDHIRTIDREARKLELIGQVPDSVMNEITAKLSPLLGF